METEATLRDAQIREALAPRLARAASRQEMTREAASLLFFTYGVYPSAKTVREFTNHGSLADINLDLRKFWSEIREKSQISLNMPGVPSSVVHSLEKAIRHVWKDAVDEANKTLDGERSEIQMAIDAALAKTTAAEASKSQAENELRQERERRSQAEGQIEALRAEIEGIRAMADHWKSQAENEAAARQLADSQHRIDLKALQEARERDADMLQGEIKFAKMQIEAARGETRDIKERYQRDVQSREEEITAIRVRTFGLEESISKLTRETVEAKVRAEQAERRLTENGALSASGARQIKRRPALPRVLRRKVVV